MVACRRLYDELGVPPGAGAEDIRRAFRRRAMSCHPDKGGDAEEFKRLGRAYDVLKDPARRQEYDATGEVPEEGRAPRPVHPFAGIFGPGGLFGAQRAPALEVAITLEEACAGCTRRVRLPQPGCGACGGTGRAHRTRVMGPLVVQELGTEPCGACGGSGAPKGASPLRRTVDVILPPGVRDGAEVLARGAGPRGEDARLLVRVAPHPDFAVSGDDLVLTRRISFIQSIAGVDVAVPHPCGGEVRLHTDELTGGVAPLEPGWRYVLRGRGLPRLGKARGHGDLQVRFLVDYAGAGACRETWRRLRELVGLAPPERQHERT